MVALGAVEAVGESTAKAGKRAIKTKATKIVNGAKLHFKGSKAGMALASAKSRVDSKISAVKKRSSRYWRWYKRNCKSSW